jgi:hypothetical protein
MDSDRTGEQWMIYAVHILRRIKEKTYEYNTQTYILSIVFKHAFHSIYGHKMIKKYYNYKEYSINLYD